MIRDFNQLLARVKEGDNKRVVIAAAQSASALEAAVMARKENLADSILTGDKGYIVEFLKKEHPDYADAFEIVDTGQDLDLACREAVNLIKKGKGHLILKGKASTAQLLKGVLDKENGLRTGSVMSDVLAYEHLDKLMLMSDGGINLYPEIKEMIAIINNAVKVAHALENEKPRVAVLAAVESVNPKMPCTIDASLLAKMNDRGQISGCYVDGPLAFDNAVSEEAARTKGIESEVAGKADILIFPNIEAGNVFGKTLTYYCHYRVAHVVMGAKVPILIASRADNAETKMLSMALGILAAT